MGVPSDACLLLPPKWSPVIVWAPNLYVTSLCTLGYSLTFPSTAALGFSIANIVLRPYAVVPLILLANATVAVIACKCLAFSSQMKAVADAKF